MDKKVQVGVQSEPENLKKVQAKKKKKKKKTREFKQINFTKKNKFYNFKKWPKINF